MSKYDDLVKKLKEIFQIDRPELDFGIYRILNSRVREINDYLENRLKAKVVQSLAASCAANVEGLQKEVKEKEEQYRADGIDPDTVPRVRELRRKLTEYGVGTSEHENAVFTHLLTFFSRYYDKGDFISQRRYKGDTYAIPYAGEEVVLHWANKDQYYTKSGENFSNYAFKLDDGRSVRFRLVTADTAKDNRKDNDRERRFVLIDKHTRTLTDDEGEEYEEELLPIEEVNGELVLRFEYKAMPKGSKQEDLVDKAVKIVLDDPIVKARWLDLSKREPTEKNPQRTLLEKCLTSYTTKNTADYFIHKDLGGFLRRELDFYIKNEVIRLDDVQNAERFADIEKNLRLIQNLRAIALDLITFLAQLEDFQKKLWLKKKFVVSTHYCITLDRVPESLYPVIAANDAQRQEWVRLFAIDDLGGYSEPLTVDFLKSQPFLVLDTALFNAAFKTRVLDSFDDVDEKLDGLLIHSENSQALRFLRAKYESRIDAVITDPPYNTDDDDFYYKDNYAHSTWATMIDERLNDLSYFLKDTSWLSFNINDIEFSNLVSLLDAHNLKPVSVVAVKMSHMSGMKMSHADRKPPKIKEYITLSNVSEKARITPVYEQCSWWDAFDRYDSFLHKNNSEDPKDWTRTSLRKAAIDSGIEIEDKEKFEYFCIRNAEFIYQRAKNDSLYDLPRDGQFRRIVTPTGMEKIALDGKEVLFAGNYLKEINGEKVPAEAKGDIWNDIGINNSHNEGGVSFENGKKPVKLFERLVSMLSNDNSIILDIFAGSGTLAHAIFNVNRKSGNRKFILIEMGNFFDSILKERVCKSLYSSDWQKGKPIENSPQTSCAFKYISLESYEDTLNNLQLRRTAEQQSLLDTLSQSAKDDYLLHYLLDIESRSSLLSVEQFNKPFDCKLKVAVDSAGAYEERTIDLVETFNYLIGLRVKHIDMQRDKGFVSVTGWLPTGEKTLVLWRDVEQVDYETLNRLCDKLAINPADSEFEIVYINGDHNIPSVFTSTEAEGGITKTLKIRQIEPEFLSRMFAVEEV